VIGRIFYALALVQQWGSGLQRMTAVCRESGLAPPVFEELATRERPAFRAVFSANQG
jgi:predicted HTH transcriptional regulator